MAQSSKLAESSSCAANCSDPEKRTEEPCCVSHRRNWIGGFQAKCSSKCIDVNVIGDNLKCLRLVRVSRFRVKSCYVSEFRVRDSTRVHALVNIGYVIDMNARKVLKLLS